MSTDPGFSGGCGFLAWDPEQSATPPGIAERAALVSSISDLVLGAGAVGCGFEAQLESMVRFLVDPHPYSSISIDGDGNIQKNGEDATILRQRADFLRDTSLLAVVMLTDENDCSTKAKGQYYIPLLIQDGSGAPFRMPRARTECASNPNDECCRPCRSSQEGCPADPACAQEFLTAEDDNINLRCFHQKQRFGIDFLYPTSRYVNAFTQFSVNTTSDDLAVRDGDAYEPNPIFSDLHPDDDSNAVRVPEDVVLVGIVGVPWQDIARRSVSGVPDLVQGRDAAGRALGGFMTGAELEANGIWSQIVFDPSQYVDPADPLMHESVDVRSGPNPATGEALQAPSSGTSNSLNGHEYSIPAADDLQYACIFPLQQSRDCSDANNLGNCDCTDPTNDNPLCAANPNDPLGPTSRTLQVNAKAFPGLRQLAVLRGLGPQGVVASVCPAQTTTQTAADFGYRPAVNALLEHVARRLGPPAPP